MSCTCAGTNADYPWQHEDWCGRIERDDDCSCGDSVLDPGCVEHGHLAVEPAVA